MKYIIFVAMCLQYCLGLWMGYRINPRCPVNEGTGTYEYYINLEQDSIYVMTDHCVDTTIHFDELEEFLIRDNL